MLYVPDIEFYADRFSEHQVAEHEVRQEEHFAFVCDTHAELQKRGVPCHYTFAANVLGKPVPTFKALSFDELSTVQYAASRITWKHSKVAA